MALSNFLIGLPAMLLCLILQVAVAFSCVRYYVRQTTGGPAHSGFLAGIRPLLIALWGLLFLQLGEFGELYEAIYHSAVNFTSLGYGDVVMSKEHKLLGPLEALNGVLMLGMTAAALMAILQHLIKTQAKANQPDSDDHRG